MLTNREWVSSRRVTSIVQLVTVIRQKSTVAWCTQKWLHYFKYVPPPWKQIFLLICVPLPGKHVSLVICVPLPAKLVSLVICVPLPGKHVFLVICVSLPGKHISLVICVSLPGKHVSLVICGPPTWETQIPSDMCSPT